MGRRQYARDLRAQAHPVAPAEAGKGNAVELWLLWLVVGFVLVIAELLTGTFYLLVIGLGAFAGAVIAWAGGNELVQAIVAGVVAVGGAFYVHHWHAARRQHDDPHGNFLDRGQSVVLEAWTNELAGFARVKYRGTTWDARLAEPAARPVPGATLYIEALEGNTLVVASAPPAR
jgi:membrane protein implicated in regulation of membrane protease activity